MTMRTLRPSLPAIFSSRRHFLKVAHVQWSTPEGERVYQGREPRAGGRVGVVAMGTRGITAAVSCVARKAPRNDDGLRACRFS